jgi:glycolate oxidase FAD binding subunit
MHAPEPQLIAEKIRAAGARLTPLVVRGGGTKDFLGRRTEGEILDVSALRGIVHYEPTELVITARAGTPLAEIETVLAECGQMLGFEPPRFGPTATLGGTIACGLSGPARPFRGAARDFVLGAKIVNGEGQVLRFGGEVMKNVAGYDVSRLMCGAYGTLGVLLEVSLKVLPRPASETTLVFEIDSETAFARMSEWQRSPLPVSGLCYAGGLLHARLSGAEQAVTAARRRLGGEVDVAGNDYWLQLREQRSAFFADGAELWRLSVPSTTHTSMIPGEQLVDWGGALRWLRTTDDPDTLFTVARAAGGHATRWRSSEADQVFQPLPPPMLTLQRRLKKAFDPHNILNRGRVYPEL